MAVIFNDTFTVSIDTALGAHTPDSGSGWVRHNGWNQTLTINAANDYVVNTGSSAGVYYSDADADADYSVTADIVITDGSEASRGAGVMVRVAASPTQDGYLLRSRAGSNLWQLYRFNGGTATLIDTISATISAATYNVKLKVTTDGSNNPVFECWIDTVQQTWDTAAATTVTDNSASKITSAGYPGIWINDIGAATNAAIDNYSVDSEGASSSLTLTDIANNRIFQRVVATNNKSITLSGTYSGTPTSIQARIVLDGTSTEVVTWTTIDASPSGGTFSGSITVPEGGWYNAQVRFGNETGTVSNGSNAWGIGILIGCIGQSNIENWFTDGSGQVPNSLLVKYQSGAWAALGAASNGATAFGNAIITGLTTAIPVGLVNYSIGGTALRQEADSGNGYWLNLAASSIYDNFKTAVTALGGSLEFIIWGQGERDARSGAVTEAEYQSSLSAFIVSQVRADVGNASASANLPFIIRLLGRGTGPDNDVNFQAIRSAQESHAYTTADVYSWTTIDEPLADTIHATPAGYTTDGTRAAQVVLNILGEQTYHRGPTITSWTSVSSTQTDITISHNGGTDYTPVTGITGFEVLDDGATVAISAAVQQSATTIRLTHTAIVGTQLVRYLYGANPDISALVIDNSALTLPLEGATYISEAGAPPASKTVVITLVNRDNAEQANLTGLKYAFFDQSSPQNLLAPTVKGIAETTNSNGILEIDVGASKLNVGATGYLIVSDTDGTATQYPSCKAFAGPVIIQ